MLLKNGSPAPARFLCHIQRHTEVAADPTEIDQDAISPRLLFSRYRTLSKPLQTLGYL
jgi:hypothetical protein